jgi:uncharacterized protein YggE
MNKKFVFVPLTCFFSILAFHLQNAHAQHPHGEAHHSRGIVVSGECLTKVVQDRGSVVVGSTTVAKTTKEASEKAIKAHESIKSRVLELKLKDFISETAEYSVNQECSYEQGKRHCEGFRARLATRFETSEIGRIGDIIAISSQLGSEEVSDLSTFASPETLKSAREACLEMAMKNAASKAQILARGAGVALGKLLLIEENSEHGGERPMPISKRAFEAAAMSDMASAAPSIDARPLDLRVEITAQYGIN